MTRVLCPSCHSTLRHRGEVRVHVGLCGCPIRNTVFATISTETVRGERVFRVHYGDEERDHPTYEGAVDLLYREMVPAAQRREDERAAKEEAESAEDVGCPAGTHLIETPDGPVCRKNAAAPWVPAVGAWVRSYTHEEHVMRVARRYDSGRATIECVSMCGARSAWDPAQLTPWAPRVGERVRLAGFDLVRTVKSIECRGPDARIRYTVGGWDWLSNLEPAP